MIDSVGRRRLFISMAIGMCVVLVAEAICVANGGFHAGIAAVFFVFAFEGCFTWGKYEIIAGCVPLLKWNRMDGNKLGLSG